MKWAPARVWSPPVSGSEQPRIRVAALIVRGGQVLLVKHRKDNQEYWMLPGGGVDLGEGLTEALSRELEEETGLQILPGRLLLAVDTIAPDASRHVVHLIFAAEVTGGVLARGEDPRIILAEYVPVGLIQSESMLPDIREELYSLATCLGEHGVEYLGKRWITLD
jgi:8-oxo-dGTP diphosphatase